MAGAVTCSVCCCCAHRGSNPGTSDPLAGTLTPSATLKSSGSKVAFGFQLDRVYKRSELGPALRSTSVRGFSLRSSTLVVFFRLQLDRRRTTT